ncbi:MULTISPECIES: thiamine pyrophosphate-requiring protein [unclassified Bosea (in: a-proteobacteria)]|uniref:thiamine pyrophosphate-requiring protein n=1 Tax=unclassified Bosea (in: a-proteobacteria) TaxID=2653178 RepID=UPI000F7536B8|nr:MULTISPECIES: thiamine pyrophosphate-requiring protein [unclassified Bosea (in: a-proteobacteria)]AZO82067.1 thiamine pyrophosphate-requiring protein [Bosea sp. Tri-49]RXT24642.1 thiamine pyrophosphate-requiring protein [Bosea sp. Tri-39]RXT42477.1 thiamine pyrophosphate-requiring protein [Bosea sp. Tri-54]
MADSVADFIWNRLHDWGVRRVYGYPGDGIGGLIAALQRHENRISFIQARHEEMAALMASGESRFTNEVGVCIATSGPGAVHVLNGLYDARLDHRPVLALVGQQARTAMGAHYQQDLDLQSLFKDVAGAYVETASVAEQVPHLIDRAYRIAKAERRVTCVILPNDLQTQEMRLPGRKHSMTFSGVGIEMPTPVPGEAALQRAADILNSGERVAMLVGAGALGATDQVLAVAERLQAGIAKSLLGKAAVPDDVAFCTGSIGLLGTRASWEMMQGCDTLLMVGSGFPYAEFLPEVGQARGVQIDLDAGMLGLRYPMEANLLGDAAATLTALLPLLEQKSAPDWRAQIEENARKSWEELTALAEVEADPINPQHVVRELSSRLPEASIVTADSGTTTVWYARNLRFRAGMMGSVSGTLATMGCAVPYAIAAKFAYPDRPVIALVGDGAMQMNGLGELVTIARYWQGWSDPRLIVMVLNNRELAYVTWEERIQAGDPKWPSSQHLPDLPYAEIARLMGIDGERVTDPAQVGPAWDRALAARQPFVLDMVTDPDIPPLPSHITFEQARGFAGALVAGDPAASSVLAKTARSVLSTFLPGQN